MNVRKAGSEIKELNQTHLLHKSSSHPSLHALLHALHRLHPLSFQMSFISLLWAYKLLDRKLVLNITYTRWPQCHQYGNSPLLCHLKLHLHTAYLGSALRHPRNQLPKCKHPAPAPTSKVPGQKDGAGHHLQMLWSRTMPPTFQPKTICLLPVCWVLSGTRGFRRSSSLETAWAWLE